MDYGNYQGGYGNNNNFALIVVLFILLIIVGTAFINKY
ncbi:YjcZ family sporulation protein [Rummeliibacillus sp. JY-2-4R]